MNFSYYAQDVTLSFDSSKCKRCGRCTQVCPHNVFEADASGMIVSVHRERCMECGACKKNCPFEAIEVHAGVGCAAALINAKISKGKEVCC